MPRYSGNGSVVVGTNKTILTLISTAAIRPKLYELSISCGASPADLTTIFRLIRFTGEGTEGSGFVPVPLDPDTVAATADYGVGVFSPEPTYTAIDILLSVAVHQKLSYRWVAKSGSEFIVPAIANNGIGLESLSSGGTAAHVATMLHEE